MSVEKAFDVEGKRYDRVKKSYTKWLLSILYFIFSHSNTKILIYTHILIFHFSMTTKNLTHKELVFDTLVLY